MFGNEHNLSVNEQLFKGGKGIPRFIHSGGTQRGLPGRL